MKCKVEKLISFLYIRLPGFHLYTGNGSILYRFERSKQKIESPFTDYCFSHFKTKIHGPSRTQTEHLNFLVTHESWILKGTEPLLVISTLYLTSPFTLLSRTPLLLVFFTSLFFQYPVNRTVDQCNNLQQQWGKHIVSVVIIRWSGALRQYMFPEWSCSTWDSRRWDTIRFISIWMETWMREEATIHRPLSWIYLSIIPFPAV